MIEIEDMRRGEMEELLKRICYAHLACARDNVPYVVPVHYAFDGVYLYVYTTEGKKTDIIRANPTVCVQVEDVANNKNWKSVIVTGTAEQVTDEAERERALDVIAKINPTLTPAVSIRWMDSWVRENVEVVLRIEPRTMTGRATVGGDSGVPFAPGGGNRNSVF